MTTVCLPAFLLASLLLRYLRLHLKYSVAQSIKSFSKARQKKHCYRASVQTKLDVTTDSTPNPHRSDALRSLGSHHFLSWNLRLSECLGKQCPCHCVLLCLCCAQAPPTVRQGDVQLGQSFTTESSTCFHEMGSLSPPESLAPQT